MQYSEPVYVYLPLGVPTTLNSPTLSFPSYILCCVVFTVFITVFFAHALILAHQTNTIMPPTLIPDSTPQHGNTQFKCMCFHVRYGLISKEGVLAPLVSTLVYSRSNYSCNPLQYHIVVQRLLF